MKLQAIKIKNTETCVTYAVQRIGLSEIAFDYHSIMNSGDFHIRDYVESDLRVGDILLWNKNSEAVFLPNYIDGKGVIISTKVRTRIHMGVYEGDNKFSDCVRSDTPNKLPKLQMRLLFTMERKPDKVLRYKHFQNDK